jgi:hypothetical protein
MSGEEEAVKERFARAKKKIEDEYNKAIIDVEKRISEIKDRTIKRLTR